MINWLTEIFKVQNISCEDCIGTEPNSETNKSTCLKNEVQKFNLIQYQFSFLLWQVKFPSVKNRKILHKDAIDGQFRSILRDRKSSWDSPFSNTTPDTIGKFPSILWLPWKPLKCPVDICKWMGLERRPVKVKFVKFHDSSTMSINQKMWQVASLTLDQGSCTLN